MNWKDTIRMLRKSMLLSQEEFAARIGVSFATVNRWEKGQYSPTIKTQRKLAKLLGIKEKNGIYEIDREK